MARPGSPLEAVVAALAVALGGARADAVRLCLRAWFLALAHARGAPPEAVPSEQTAALLAGSREAAAALLATPWCDRLPALHAAPDAAGVLADAFSRVSGVAGDAHQLGRSYELLASDGRKGAGRYFTDPALAARVADLALAPWLAARPRDASATRVCDPACGGGAFLLAALGALAASGADRARALEGLYGVDVDPDAAEVTRMALWLAAGTPGARFAALAARVVTGDALAADAPDVLARGGFDVVLGNPPWVAYAGRSTAPLDPRRRAFLRARYGAFRGFPTLHGAFVERAAALVREGGVVGLLLPSPVADLAGYGPTRAALAARCAPVEPLEEFGADAFEGVVQPCFALVARRRPEPVAPSPAPWTLRERATRAARADVVAAPAALAALAAHPRLPAALFGEMGFQSAGAVVATLMARGPAADARHTYPLREGKNVDEFQLRPPALWLAPDAGALRAARCRLRPAESYARAAFVVRQTAAHPIAALHLDPLPFRNTLLAGFALPDWPAALVVGLLNSALVRAAHRAAQRDGRQRVFPQVKVAHLRALPAPAARDAALEARIADLARALCGQCRAPTADERALLDGWVFELYGVPRAARGDVVRFAARR